MPFSWFRRRREHFEPPWPVPEPLAAWHQVPEPGVGPVAPPRGLGSGSGLLAVSPVTRHPDRPHETPLGPRPEPGRLGPPEPRAVEAAELRVVGMPVRPATRPEPSYVPSYDNPGDPTFDTGYDPSYGPAQGPAYEMVIEEAVVVVPRPGNGLLPAERSARALAALGMRVEVLIAGLERVDRHLDTVDAHLDTVRTELRSRPERTEVLEVERRCLHLDAEVSRLRSELRNELDRGLFRIARELDGTDDREADRAAGSGGARLP